MCSFVRVPGVFLEHLTPEVDVDEGAVDGVDGNTEEDCDEVLDKGVPEAVGSRGAVHPDHTAQFNLTSTLLVQLNPTLTVVILQLMVGAKMALLQLEVGRVKTPHGFLAQYKQGRLIIPRFLFTKVSAVPVCSQLSESLVGSDRHTNISFVILRQKPL